MKSWITSTDLGNRGFLMKSVGSKYFLRKPYLKNMSPILFCYDNFSADFIKSLLHKGCYAKSVSSESRFKNSIWEFYPLNFFIFVFLHQNCGFDNLRTPKFEVNKTRGKSRVEEKGRKCDKWILHVSYQLLVMFSTFSLLVYIKCFYEKMSVNATDMAYPKSTTA